MVYLLTKEDFLKSQISQEIQQEYPDLYKNNPSEFFRLCMRRYDEQHTIRLSGLNRVKRIFTIEEMVKSGLRSIAKDYETLSKEQKKSRNKKAITLISVTYCLGTFDIKKMFKTESAKELYKYYFKIKKGERDEDKDDFNFYII